MRRLLLIALSLLVVHQLALSQEMPSSDEQLQVGTVKLEWAPVSGASSYSLRFISEIDPNDSFQFESKTPQFSNQIPQGSYSFQIRSIDNDGPGPWSSPIKIQVEKLDTLNLIPEDKAVLDIDHKKNEDFVAFEWMPVPHASFYYFMINGRNGFKERIKSKETSLKLKLKKGVTYTWKAIPIQKNRVIHETQGKPFEFYIRGGRLDIPRISQEIPPRFQHVKWQKVKGAQAYSIKIFKRPLLEEQWTLLTQSEQASEIFPVTNKFEPAEYKIEVKAISKWAPHSETDVRQFTVKPRLTSHLQKTEEDSR